MDKRPRLLALAFAVAVIATLIAQPLPVNAQQADGFRFTLIRMNAGETVGNLLYADPPDNATGGGDLDAIVQAAVDQWSEYIHDDVHITLRYGWHAKPAGVSNLGGAGPTWVSADGTEVEATLFLNRTYPAWWLDPTPHESSEFEPVVDTYTDLGGGPVITTRRANTLTGGPASGRIDAVQVAAHELGHVVGFSWNYPMFHSLAGTSQANSYQGQLEIASPLPRDGSIIAISYSHMALSSPLMVSGLGSGRKMITDIDVLGAAMFAGYDNISLPSQSSVAPGRFGDVNCDAQSTVVDALAIAQFTVGIRSDAGTCPLVDPAGELVALVGDVNTDSQTNILDALLIAQCQVGQLNDLCPQ